MITRPENWPDLLANHLQSWRWKEFTWGQTDCVHFCADWLAVIGYSNPLAGLPKWESALGAARMFTALGGFEHSVQAQMAALECPEIPLTFAMRGDLAIVRIDAERLALAIVNGRGAAVRCENLGVSEIPYLANAVKAWKV